VECRTARKPRHQERLCEGARRVDHERGRGRPAFAVPASGTSQRVGESAGGSRGHGLGATCRLGAAPGTACRAARAVRGPGKRGALSQGDGRRLDRKRQGRRWVRVPTPAVATTPTGRQEADGQTGKNETENRKTRSHAASYR